MRDRLIELLLEVDYALDTECSRRARDSAECIADYLLEKGVIVPPCKEGDTVYCLWEDIDYFRKVEKLFIEEDVCQGIVIDMGQVKILPIKYGSRADRFYRLLDCCPTKEEAEQALSKLQANNRQVKKGVE